MRNKLPTIALLIILCACASLGDKPPVAAVQQDLGGRVVSESTDGQPDYEAQRILQEKSSSIVLQSSTEALFVSEAPKDPEESYAQNRSAAAAVADAGLWFLKALVEDAYGTYTWIELLKNAK